ncbi:unnamed protein product [Boreogadus saida]
MSMVCFRDKDRTVVYYQLLGGNHDVDPPVVGIDCAGVVVRRPGELSQPNSAPSQATAHRLLFPVSGFIDSQSHAAVSPHNTL